MIVSPPEMIASSSSGIHFPLKDSLISIMYRVGIWKCASTLKLLNFLTNLNFVAIFLQSNSAECFKQLLQKNHCENSICKKAIGQNIKPVWFAFRPRWWFYYCIVRSIFYHINLKFSFWAILRQKVLAEDHWFLAHEACDLRPP